MQTISGWGYSCRLGGARRLWADPASSKAPGASPGRLPVKPLREPAAAAAPPGPGSAPPGSPSAPAADSSPAPAPPPQSVDHLSGPPGEGEALEKLLPPPQRLFFSFHKHIINTSVRQPEQELPADVGLDSLLSVIRRENLKDFWDFVHAFMHRGGEKNQHG